jgi:integrase
MATKRKDRNRWQAMARIAPGPKGRIAVYGETAEEAEAKKRELEAEAKSSSQAPPALPEGSFGAFVYSVWAPRTYPDVRPTTRAAYDDLLVHHILPVLAMDPIDAIGYERLEDLKRSIRRKDRRPGEPSRRRVKEVVVLAKSILRLYATLQRARGLAAREDWRLVKSPLAPRKKARVDPEDDFTERLLREAQGTWLLGPIFCALFLGLRRGEVCGLKWSAIDRDRLRVSVHEQRHPELPDGSVTKGRPRSIPIPTELLERLDAMGDKSSVYVFTMDSKRKGRIPIIENEITRWTPRLCKAAGLARRSFHDLRSFAASNLAALDIDAVTIMEILGHTRLDTTELYLYSREQRQREALKRLLGTVDTGLPDNREHA